MVLGVFILGVSGQWTLFPSHPFLCFSIEGLGNFEFGFPHGQVRTLMIHGTIFFFS
jgi:hypothetical protein